MTRMAVEEIADKRLMFEIFTHVANFISMCPRDEKQTFASYDISKGVEVFTRILQAHSDAHEEMRARMRQEQEEAAQVIRRVEEVMTRFERDCWLFVKGASSCIRALEGFTCKVEEVVMKLQGWVEGARRRRDAEEEEEEEEEERRTEEDKEKEEEEEERFVSAKTILKLEEELSSTREKMSQLLRERAESETVLMNVGKEEEQAAEGISSLPEDALKVVQALMLPEQEEASCYESPWVADAPGLLLLPAVSLSARSREVRLASPSSASSSPLSLRWVQGESSSVLQGDKMATVGGAGGKIDRLEEEEEEEVKEVSGEGEDKRGKQEHEMNGGGEVGWRISLSSDASIKEIPSKSEEQRGWEVLGNLIVREWREKTQRRSIWAWEEGAGRRRRRRCAAEEIRRRRRAWFTMEMLSSWLRMVERSRNLRKAAMAIEQAQQAEVDEIGRRCLSRWSDAHLRSSACKITCKGEMKLLMIRSVARWGGWARERREERGREKKLRSRGRASVLRETFSVFQQGSARREELHSDLKRLERSRELLAGRRIFACLLEYSFRRKRKSRAGERAKVVEEERRSTWQEMSCRELGCDEKRSLLQDVRRAEEAEEGGGRAFFLPPFVEGISGGWEAGRALAEKFESYL
ncbi:hypothetical protein GUITHDRAFT_134275 [Guillardia theta CCMP2712]|uniref:Uncharacterized protein n=1 Tax=Guillardia theta (strain CCMP2712) TaxID=905079 RepID=L1JTS0_GUITC|nr:hypothetical protein GUITHDRAFT_134275 [Guillardia theta CCMP2712]EKX51961.1 hypothetical protein GUITHDRAFT_134275 [Guillardia theta CCMP2712]|eukprot:XP_005838941.1 hypothetical protein GUITHDRAFT_134275 [Guillardia theta CCMP2712]